VLFTYHKQAINMLHAIPAARSSSEEACTSRTRRCAAALMMSRVIHHTTQQLVTKSIEIPWEMAKKKLKKLKMECSQELLESLGVIRL
jgi:hypothetical protein